MTSAAPITIEHIFICEEIRMESGGKLTVLGLYGFAPHVKINVPAPGPLTRISFVFSAAPVDYEMAVDDFDIGFGPVGGEPRFHFLNMPSKKIAPGKSAQFIVQLVNPQMPTFGRYVAVLRRHGTVLARGEFELRETPKASGTSDSST